MRCQLAILAAAAVTAACSGANADAEESACRTTTASPRYREAIAAGEKLLPRLFAGLRTPGLSLAVAAKGRVIWSVTCGVADISTARPSAT